MTWVIKNHKILIILTGMILLVLIVWMIISRQNIGKIPSRGVFV